MSKLFAAGLVALLAYLSYRAVRGKKAEVGEAAARGLAGGAAAGIVPK